tara:strand:+ start:746 stop:1057 length:312 start_codon:yes stop_codon:yes gene_type:complete
MTMTTRDQIRSEIIDHLEQLKETQYPEDLLTELADSNTPVYYSGIISEWQEMPSDYNDRWQELGYDGSASIMTLMQIDLCIYYQEQFLEVWEEVKSEHAIPEA